MSSWLAFGCGLVLGTFVGIWLVCACHAAARADRDALYWSEAWKPRTGDAGRDAE